MSNKESARGEVRDGDAARDPRSEQVRESLRRRWRDLKKMPPAEREQFLRSTEGIVALGARMCHQLLKEIDRQHKRTAATVCSSSWLDAFDHDLGPGQLLPQTVAADGRRMAVRMMLSREGTRMSGDGSVAPEETQPTRRWTPPQAVAVEDFLDGMNHLRAAYYEHPASPSARSIQGIRLRKGIEKKRSSKKQDKRDKKANRRADRWAEMRGATLENLEENGADGHSE